MTLLSMVLSTMIVGQAEWLQMTSGPGSGRYWAAATGNSTVAIAGTGRLQFGGTNNTVVDMWLYTAATDSWESIPPYPGGVREGADAFTIGERLFMGFGSPFIQFTSDLYEFVPATGQWVPMPSACYRSQWTAPSEQRGPLEISGADGRALRRCCPAPPPPAGRARSPR